MRVTTLPVCILCVALLTVSGRTRGQGQENIDVGWLAKGQKDGTAHLGKVEAILDTLEEVREADVESNNPRGIRSISSRSLRAGSNTLLETSSFFVDPTKPPSITLECENADYHFSLTKSKQSSPFALTEYAPGQPKLAVWKKAGGLHAEAYYHLKDAIRALAPEARTNLRAVRFDKGSATLSIMYAKTLRNMPFTETVLVEPDKGWLLKSRRMESPHIIHTTEYNYGKVIDGVTLPTSSTSSTTPKSQKAGPPNRIVVRVTDVRRTTMSSKDFRLSAFGFPEPGESVQMTKPTPWYLRLLAAAVACGLLSYGCVCLRRYLRAPPTAP